MTIESIAARDPDFAALIKTREVEQTKLDERIAVMQAECGPTGARVTTLAGEVQAAARRLSCARGHLTRAKRTGDPDRIRTAQERYTARSREFDEISDASIREGQALIDAGLRRLGDVLDQIGPAWDAASAVTDALARPRPPVPVQEM